MKTVDIFTDGACSGNPGKGGWATILRYEGHEKEMCGGENETTNNRMELTAFLEGLKALKVPCHVNLYSDSKYLIDSITKGWVFKWRDNNWIKPDKKEVKNVDLWLQLLQLLDIHKVDYHWVKGHDGHPENERCDKMAVAYCQSLPGKAPFDEENG